MKYVYERTNETVLTGVQEVQDRWLEYFKGLLNEEIENNTEREGSMKV